MKLPPESDLWTVYPLVPVPLSIWRPSVELTAYHEAGHVVMAEWGGIPVVKATVKEKGIGFAEVDWKGGGDPTPATGHPIYAAQAAAICHAGIIAEMIHAGEAWEGVTVRQGKDWESALLLMQGTFGHGLAGHGYSQRVAHAVLIHNWDRVKEIAAVLLEKRQWTPEPQEDNGV